MKGNLADVLPRRQKIAKKHFEALPYKEVPTFLEEVRAMVTPAAQATEFLILTAARSNELRGATWGEIDLDAGIWSIPPERMKSGSPHRVPLSPRAVEILRDQKFDGPDGLIFPAKSGREIDAKSMIRPKGYTVHGLRSSFRDFAGDETSFPREIAEAALAHTADEVERSYRRGDALELRRKLMIAWEQFCAKPKPGKVVPIRGAV
jgi:integrase